MDLALLPSLDGFGQLDSLAIPLIKQLRNAACPSRLEKFVRIVVGDQPSQQEISAIPDDLAFRGRKYPAFYRRSDE